MDSIISHPDLVTADAVVMGVPYDNDASFGKGAALGPAAILDCLNTQIEFFERHSRTDIAEQYCIAAEILDETQHMRAEDMVRYVKNKWSDISSFPVLLGGTHAVSIGAFMALSQQFNPKEVTIVQIDAHLDMRQDDGDYSNAEPNQYAHSCVMRRAHELGFRTCSVGIRAYGQMEIEYATQHELTVFEWGRGTQPTIDEILSSIKTDSVYLSIDVDGFDPSVFPATGTPVPGGLSWEFGTALLRSICQEKQVLGADIVEIAPNGHSGVSEYAAAQLCYDIISYKLLKQDGKLEFNQG